MNNKSFIRKVIYLVLMAVLLVPLYLLSAPSFLGPNGERSEGGYLTQLREDHGLSQANLGEIDPASESMKLATLGMRGVAANLLWERANEYKKREEWDNLRATLNQIAKLQPNFISVWQFQAWNLSYNVSVEFDNYEHRYHWVKKGIEFMLQGIRYNHNEPRLLSDLGWFFGHKLGRSDEYIQFRRKYNTDEDFHESLSGQIDVDQAKDYKDQPDNWLTAHQWYNVAQDVVDLKAVPIKGKNPLVFHSYPGKALIRYGDAIENEGVFGEVSRLAWERAYNRWIKYGDREIPTSYGYKIRLNEGERWTEMVNQRLDELEGLAPGVKERLIKERKAKLSDDELRLLGADRVGLSAEDYDVAVTAEAKIAVTPEDVVNAIEDPDKRREGRLMVNRILNAKAYSTTIRRYRDVVNFNYWRTRCEVEQQDRAIDARKYLWDANELYEEADLVGAAEKYEESWKRWASIYNDYEVLAEDVTAEDLVDQIKKYRTVLTQLDREFPPQDFPMYRLVANYPDEFGISKEEANRMIALADEMDARAEAAEGTSEDGESSDEADSAASTDEAASTSEAGEPSENDDSASAAVTPAVPPSTDIDAGVQQLLDAQELYESAELEGAREKYEAAFKSWAGKTLDDSVRETLLKHIRYYRILLGQLDQPFPPKDFVFGDFVKKYAADFGYTDDEAEHLFAK